jgi:predicted MFS family arabinose efflux permease
MNQIRWVINLYKSSFADLSKEIWLLSFVMLINRAGAMVLTFMSLYLTKALGFSLTDTGYVLAFYGAGSILGAYSGGLLTDRYGYYYIQLYSLLFSAVMLFVLIFLKTFWAISICVFMFSLISDMLRPANSVAIAAYSKPENRTRSFSLMRLSINLGFSIGPALGGFVAGYLGFRWIFLIDGVTCIAAAFLLLRYLPQKKKTPEDHEKTAGEPKGLSAYRDKQYLGFILLVSVFAMIFFQLFTSVPVFLESEWKMNEIQIGILLALNGLLIVIFEMPVVRSLENYKRFMILIATGCVTMALGFIFLGLTLSGVWMAVGYIVFITIAEILAMPFMINYAVSRPTPDRQGQYMALYSIAYGAAHIIAPAGGMYLAERMGFSALYIMMTGASLLLAVGFYSLRRRSMV